MKRLSTVIGMLLFLAVGVNASIPLHYQEHSIMGVKNKVQNNLTYINADGDTMTGDLTLEGTLHGDTTLRIVDGIETPFIQMDTGVATNPVHSEGQFYYDDDSKTLSLNMSASGVSLQMGQEQFLRATNKTGLEVLNGQMVYIDGAQGNRPTIALASSSTHLTSDTIIGMATHNISNNQTGYITTFGIVRDLNTSAYSEGDRIWTSSEAGAVTNVQPVSPLHAVAVGFVITSSVSEGTILVRIDIGGRLNDLHDVEYVTTLEVNQVIQYNASALRWENQSNLTIEGSVSAEAFYGDGSGIVNISAGAISHNLTSGLQGGDGVDQFYHFNAANHAEMGGWISSVELGTDGSITTEGEIYLEDNKAIYLGDSQDIKIHYASGGLNGAIVGEHINVLTDINTQDAGMLVKNTGDNNIAYLWAYDDLTSAYTQLLVTEGTIEINDQGEDVNTIIKTSNDDQLLFADGENDKLGIGTRIPSEKLHIVGSIEVDNDIILGDDQKIYLDDAKANYTYYDGDIIITVATLDAAVPNSNGWWVTDDITDWNVGLGFDYVNTFMWGKHGGLVAEISVGSSEGKAMVQFNRVGSDVDTRVKGNSDDYLVYANAGTDKVGIGTSEPTEKLEVNGNIFVRDDKNIYTGTDKTFYSTYNSGGWAETIVPDEGWWAHDLNWGYDVGVDKDNDNVELFSQSNTLDATTKNILRVYSSDPKTILNFASNDMDMQVRGDADVNLLYANAGTDRVGIGTSEPTSKLTVAGSFEIISGDVLIGDDQDIYFGDTKDGSMGYTSSINELTIVAPQSSGSSGGYWAYGNDGWNYFGLNDAYFGIGVSTDGAGAIYNVINIYPEVTIFNDLDSDVDFQVNGSTEANLIYVNAGTDKVGVGTSEPTSKLHVIGDTEITGDTTVEGVLSVLGVGTGGLTDWDIKIGNSGDYGMLKFGDATLGRTSYVAGNMDLNGTFLFRNLGGPVSSEIEFVFTESSGNSTRFALPKSGVGNATYNSRSMLLAGPAPADTDMVTVGYWQANNNIFDNLLCDTSGSGADLGVQNNLEVEGIIYVDSIIESTTGESITISSHLSIEAGITLAGSIELTSGDIALGDDQNMFFGDTNDARMLWEDDSYFITYTSTWYATTPSDNRGIFFKGNTGEAVGMYASDGANFNELAVGETITQINFLGIDADTLIKGDNDADLFWANAGTDRIGIGTNAPSEKLTVAGSVELTTGDIKLGTNQFVYLGDSNEGRLRWSGSHLLIDAPQVNMGNTLDDKYLYADATRVLVGGENALLEITDNLFDFNPNGLDVDFKIEGSTEVNLLYVNGGTDKVGIGTSEPRALLDVVGGNTYVNLIYGEMYQDDTDTLVTIETQNVDVSVEGFSAGINNGFTFQNGRELLVTVSGTYDVDWSLSFKLDGGGGSQQIEGAIGIDGVRQANTGAHRTVATITDTGDMGSPGHITVSAGDTIQLLVRNESSTNNVVVGHANISLTRVGD